MKSLRQLIHAEHGLIPLLLALLIAAGGIISIGMIMMNRTTATLQNSKAGMQQLAALEKAIRAHAYLPYPSSPAYRLPCPAQGDGDGAARATCAGTDNDGVVPYRTIGLTRADATDAFGRLISYSVDPDLNSVNFCSGATPLPGGISVNPSGGATLFVLVSHGRNGAGGWLPTGIQTPAPASALERENCIDAAANASLVTCNDPDPRAVTQGPHQGDPVAANYFDDMILAARSTDYTAHCAASDDD